MRRNKGKTPKRPSIDDYDAEYVENQEVIKYGLVDLADEINNLYNNVPDKRTKEYKEWKIRVNIMAKKYNQLSGMDIFYILK